MMIHTLIDSSTATVPTGLPTQHKLFRVPSGPFAGRLLALFARTPTNLAWSHADGPYTNWLDPANFVTESADAPFAAVMDSNADVYVAYTQQTTDALRVVKLVFANGTWATQTAVTVYDSGTSSNRYPSILKDDYDRIWVVWTRDDAGTITVREKFSVDDGLVFGSGSSDAGTDLSGSTSAGYGRLIARNNYLHCLYTTGGTALKHRDRDLDAALWNSEETLYTGTGLGSDFGAAVSAEGMLGVPFAADGKLFLKEYDGAVWGALQTINGNTVTSPSLRYIGTAPYALFLRSTGTDQNELFESHRVGGSFASAVSVLSQLTSFASVFCQDADAGTPFADLTSEAAESSGADVLHPTSGALIAAVGDAVYLGGDDRFSLARIILSTVGTVGTVDWSYWNGAQWTLFTPDSGAYHFTQSNAGVRLFTDGAGTPTDWQRVAVNGKNRYWVRAVVTVAFSTAPIGSQLTEVAKTSDVITISI